MKSLSAALQAHLDGELTTLAEIVKITRVDGAVIALTTHDRDLTVEGVLYSAEGSYSPESLSNAASLKTNDYEVSGFLDSEQIAEEDILAGLYDHARVDVAMVNWADTAQGLIPLRRGWLGEVALTDGKYVAELRGLHDLLQRRIGDTYTPECRYDLGDGRCCVNLAPLTVEGVVTGVTDKATFSDYMRAEPEGAFAYGKLTWTSGANAGLSMEVQSWDAGNQEFKLWLPMLQAIQVGDGYAVYLGCDKRFSTCCAKFANAANFGGFPHLPGVSKILCYPESHT
ncbi:MAG: DUF2163 domain-containing protein [Alphaproteobacteria bacterium]|nr:DUF2163 domain-containing protein [Alphaproteobacteria bacterium]